MLFGQRRLLFAQAALPPMLATVLTTDLDFCRSLVFPLAIVFRQMN
jgi:hypothetical protein